MTLLDNRQLVDWRPAGPGSARDIRRGAPQRQRTCAAVRGRSHRPAPARPAVAPMRYRGTGVAVSRAPQSGRPVSTRVTIALAGLAALITVWLGSLAHLSGDSPAVPETLPERLAVVQVQAGETLAQLAGRVAPDARAGEIVERIRDLNKLDSAAVDAGQTLIAPVS